MRFQLFMHVSYMLLQVIISVERLLAFIAVECGCFSHRERERENNELVSSPYIYFESQQGVFLWKIVGRSLEGRWKIGEGFDGSSYHDIRFNSPFFILNMIQRSDDSLDL